MKRIFITGICGFVGSNLAYYFKSLGFKVYGIDNFQQITKILEKKFPISVNKRLLSEFVDSLQY